MKLIQPRFNPAAWRWPRLIPGWCRRVSGSLRRLPYRWRLRLLALALLLCVWLLIKGIAWAIPIPLRSLHRPTSTLVFDRGGQLLQAFISSDDKWRIPTELSALSPNLGRCLIGFEDRRFYQHQGVNPAALARALWQNLRAGKIVSGGSTLTMQIARMMEPKPRTLSGKIREILRALQLEARYSKRQLLETYFNIAPYGGNIEGVAAASWLYFGKEPSQLSLGEAALLTALPNSPNAYRPDVNQLRAKAGRDRVLRRLRQQGTITEGAYREALAEEIPGHRQALPRLAPHFCTDLHLAYPGQPRIYTTLDLRLQSSAEDLLRLHLGGLRSEGISNGAIVVLDNVRHELLAMVGSGDFDDVRHDGQVNGATAPRSPGSALKPFLYTLAMQKGLLTPAHYVEDVPTDFSGYAPENYDRTFSGVVSAKTALERSLNLPAVCLEQALGEDDLYQLLSAVGASGLRPRNNYGLSIAIGGCEINLLDLTALYSALAAEGYYVSPRLVRDEKRAAGIKLFDEGACYLTTEILTGLRRPDLPTCWEFTTLPRVAWKTGTSYGHRDAWSIGYNPRFTVGVWLGNFSGEGARNLVGAEVAAPILFELMRTLCQGRQIKWFAMPGSVATREVCSLSGQPPGPDCPTLVEELYLPDRSPMQVCTFHQAAEIDDRTGYRLPPHYPGNRPSHRLVYIQWPPRVGSWLESTGYPVARLPQLLPDWQGVATGDAPIIRSPSQNCLYQLREGIPPEYQKICLEASAGSEVSKLFWFIDGILLGTVKPGERLFYTPVAGSHKVICQDDLGRSTDFTLVIEAAE